jgi:hypothetical protein
MLQIPFQFGFGRRKVTSKCSSLTFQFYIGEIYYLMFQNPYSCLNFQWGKLINFNCIEVHSDHNCIDIPSDHGVNKENFPLIGPYPLMFEFEMVIEGICLFFPNGNIPYAPCEQP